MTSRGLETWFPTPRLGRCGPPHVGRGIDRVEAGSSARTFVIARLRVGNVDVADVRPDEATAGWYRPSTIVETGFPRRDPIQAGRDCGATAL